MGGVELLGVEKKNYKGDRQALNTDPSYVF